MNLLNLSIFDENEGVYYCQEGDTIESICKAFSTSTSLLIKDNFLTSPVKQGDCLYIKIYKKVYTVKVGDTPETVAKALGVSVEELYQTNKINYVYPYMQVVAN